MGTLADFRRQYPQYNDMSDTELADALHRQYYSDLPKDEVFKRLNVKAPKAEQSAAAAAPAMADDVTRDIADTQKNIDRAKRQVEDWRKQLKRPISDEQMQGLYGAIAAGEKNIRTYQDRLGYMRETGQLPPAPTFGSVVSDIARGVPRALAQAPGQIAGGLLGLAGSGLQALPNFVPDLGVGKALSETGANIEEGGNKFAEDVFGSRSEATRFSPGARFAAEAGEAIGSTLPYILTEGAAGAVNTVGKAGRVARAVEGAEGAAAALSPAAQNIRKLNYGIAAGQGSQQAGQQAQEFREEGGTVTPGQEFLARLGGAGLGLTELGVIGNMIERVPVSARGAAIDSVSNFVERATAGRLAPNAIFDGAKNIIQKIESRAVGRIGLSMTEEALQEGGTQFGQNLLAQQIYNPNQKLSEGVLHSMALGAVAGGAIRGGAEVVQKVFGPRGDVTPEGVPIAPQIKQEFHRLAAQEVAAVMAANPGMDQKAAIEAVSERAEELLTKAAANVVARGEGGADVTSDAGAAVDVSGGVGAGAAPNLGAAPTGAGIPGAGEAVTGGLGEPVPSVSVPDVGARAGEPALTSAPVELPKITGAQIKATVPTIEQVFTDNQIDFEDSYGVKKLNAEQKKQAARIVLQSPEVDPYDAIGSVLERGQRLRGETVAPKVEQPKTEQPMGEAPGTFRTVTEVNGEQQVVEGPTVDETATVEKVTPSSTGLAEMGGGMASGMGESFRAMLLDKVEAGDVTENGQPSTILQAAKLIKDAGVPVDASMLERIQTGIDDARQTNNFQAAMRAFVTDTIQRAQTATQAPSITPEPQYTPQEIAENLEVFAVPEAQDRGLDPSMFREGVRDIQRGLEPLTDQQVLEAGSQETLDAYKAGRQWAQERIAEAQAAPTQAAADDIAIAKAQKKKLVSRMKKAPGKTARQKLIAIMAEEQEAELKDKSPEEVAEALGVNPFDPEYEEIVGRAGVNRQRIVQAQINKYKGNPATMTGVVAKELLQNSHDATRASMANGQITQGKVDFRVSEDGRTITIHDNGQGMTGDILAGPFLEIGSTGKGEGQHSGGFGLAKALLLYSSDKIDVITARDGKVSTLDTTGENLAEAAFADDKSLQPRIKVRDFTAEDYDLFPDGHGTIVQLRMPEKDLDPRTGETVEVKQLPTVFTTYNNLLESMLNSPLFANTNVTYNGATVPIGANFPLQDYKLFSRVGMPFGTAHVYVSRQPKEYSWDKKAHILSDGVWQFETEIKGGDNNLLPYTFYINIVPAENIKPDSALYPFNEQRKNFSDGGQKSMGKLASLLRATFGVQSFMDDVKSFGNIQYYDPSTGQPGAPIDLTPEIPQDVIDRIERSAAGDDSDIQIGENGRVIVNGNEVDTDSVDDLQKQLPKSSELIIDQSKIDPTRVILHDAADVEYEDPATGEMVRKPIVDYMREKFGDRVDGFFFLVGSKFNELRNEVAKVMNERFPGEYDALLDEAIGISLDPRYRGVSTKVPFSGMFLNPLVPESLDPFERLQGIVTTMYHELAHYKVRDHDAGFPAEMQRITAALKAAKYKQGFNFDKWVDDFVDDIIDNGYGDIIDAGQYLFATQQDRESNAYSYYDPTYNISVVYRGGRFKHGSAEQVPERGAQGEGATPDAGDAGTGGAGAEQLLGPSYEGRGGAGSRGDQGAGAQGGTEPVTDANVDQVLSVKLTKAQLKRLEEAAGIRRMKLSNMQQRIVKSRNAEETLSLSGKLMLLARGQNDDVNLLTSLFNSVPPPLLQKLLGPMMTEDVVRLAERAGMENISKIDEMVRDEYGPYINRLMQAASSVSEKWTDFASRFEEGNQALADVMYIANMYDVDPTLAASVAEYAKVDTKLIELATKLAAETDPKKKKALKGQITERRGEIQRVYYGGELQDKNGKPVRDANNKPVIVYGWNDLSDAKMGGGAGKRIFRLARDHYRNTFEEHYRLLMERIDASKFENEKAVELKSAVDEMFAKARARSIYFPLKRFGEYWVSVGKGQNSEFHLFESLGEQQDFIRKIKAEGETRFIDASQGKDTLRNGLRGKAADASVALRNILDKIEGDNVTDVDVLKDNIFQMYLMALPEADMRRRFIHREFKTGFSTDALRTFASTAVASASQLGRLAYNYRLKNLIEASYAETAGNPSKPRLDTLTREIEMRVESIMSPDINGSFDRFVSVNAKGTFLFFLSGVKSAAMNLTQLHIVGLPTLSAEFGEKATAAMATRYTAELLTGKRMAVPFRDEEGNVKLEFPKFTAEDSAYIRDLQETDPDRYAAMQKAWEYAKDHDVTESTFSSGADIYERSDTPTGDFGAVQALRRGEVLTAAQRATGNAINAMGALFHSTERIGREIMYMSAFELAYERNLKEGMDPAAAGDAAMKQADKLTRSAMFDFTNWNKSRYSKAPVGRLALQMRSYSITMSSLLFRSFYGMLPYFNKEGKAASAKVFFGVGAMTALYGGFRATQFYALGMLGYGLLNFVKGLGDDDDEEKELKSGELTPETIDREMDKYADEYGNSLTKKDMEYFIRAAWIPETFGPGGTLATKLGIGDAAAEKLEAAADIGLPGVFNVDLSSSVSLGDLWHPVATKSDDPEVRLFEFIGRGGAGATGSMYASFFKAWKQYNAGDLDKAIETGMPAMIRNFIKAQRLKDEGLVVGADRDVVLQDPSYYTLYKTGMQSLGFADAETSRNMQLDIKATDIEKEIAAEATQLLNRRYRALYEVQNNPSKAADRKFNEVERAIKIYNLNYPTNQITDEDKEKSYDAKSAEAAGRSYGLGITGNIPVREPLVDRRWQQLRQQQ